MENFEKFLMIYAVFFLWIVPLVLGIKLALRNGLSLGFLLTFTPLAWLGYALMKWERTLSPIFCSSCGEKIPLTINRCPDCNAQNSFIKDYKICEIYSTMQRKNLAKKNTLKGLGFILIYSVINTFICKDILNQNPDNPITHLILGTLGIYIMGSFLVWISCFFSLIGSKAKIQKFIEENEESLKEIIKKENLGKLYISFPNFGLYVFHKHIVKFEFDNQDFSIMELKDIKVFLYSFFKNNHASWNNLHTLIFIEENQENRISCMIFKQDDDVKSLLNFLEKNKIINSLENIKKHDIKKSYKIFSIIIFSIIITLPSIIRPFIRESIPNLVNALGLMDPDVRKEAAEKLGKAGPEAIQAIPALIKALVDKNLDVCQAAAKALDKISPEWRNTALINALSDSDSNVSGAAAKLLDKMNPQWHKTEQVSQVVSALITILADHNADVREAAAKELDKIGPQASQAIPVLITALSHDNSDVRQAAAKALDKINPQWREKYKKE